MRTLTTLGAISTRRFMREYWQRKPLLLRAAFPGFAPPLGRDWLFELAAHEEVESRLVLRERGRVVLRHGPFPRRSLPPLAQSRWTLLVQGVDLADAGGRELLARFRFVPDARLDDLMVSYATDGGGVGPHVDNYDVFLLQACGRRRWRISHQRDQRLRSGTALPLLANFHPEREWVLDPGDMLYLPPGVAHDGIAEGECITYSIGFRTPVWQELLDPWFAAFAEHAAVRGRYQDAGQRPVRHPGELPRALVTRTHEALGRLRPTRAHTERFLLEYLSEPKRQVVFDRPRRSLKPAGFARAASSHGVRLDRRSRILLGQPGVALNGELFEVERALRPLLRSLSDHWVLDAASCRRAPAALLALLHDWWLAGWLHLGTEARQ